MAHIDIDLLVTVTCAPALGMARTQTVAGRDHLSEEHTPSTAD